MNDSSALLRAIRGPIMLIAVGALAAIDHFGPFAFRQTWPALFIVFGLMKLLELSLRPPAPPPPPVGGAPYPGGQPYPGGRA